MKYFFYTILLIASLGTVGAIINPPLFQRGAALIGLELPQNSVDPAENTSDEDQLAKFLAQYPFAHNQNNTVVPETTAPAVVIPASVQPPIPPVYAVPVAESVPLPEPVLESATPAHSSNWDGEATAPIYATPVAVPYLPSATVSDWSPQPQPHQPPASQQSVYETVPPNNPLPNTFVPPQTTIPVVNDSIPVGFEQTKYSPPVTYSTSELTSAAQMSQPIHSSAIQTPAMLIENVPCYGTEMVARVGTQVILMGDILPKLRRAALRIIAENFKRMSEEERAKVSQSEIEQVITAFTENHYPNFLQEQILVALVYNDYDLSKTKAEKDFFNDKMGDDFDRTEVPDMMKEFNVENMAALKRYLQEQLGSSLEKERTLWIRERIVQQWIGMSVQRATGECTHDEMKEFYEQNQAMFTSSSRASWQEMVVLLSKYSTEQEALNKIRWMGNQVVGGAPFEEIAKANSDGFTASKGGVWDWTAKGSLTSMELEQAVFTQPIGQLSPAVIRSDKGFHIIRVLERQEAKMVPFVEAQGTIREKIRSQRVQRYQEEYFSDLRRRFPTIVVREQIDFNINSPRTASTAR